MVWRRRQGIAHEDVQYPKKIGFLAGQKEKYSEKIKDTGRTSAAMQGCNREDRLDPATRVVAPIDSFKPSGLFL